MSPLLEAFGAGVATGLWGGYELSKLVARFKEWRSERANRITNHDLKVAYGHDQVVGWNEHKGLPPTIPLRRSRQVSPNIPHAPETVQQISANPWRDDVIAALTGSGYKKSDAIKATDACSLVERASGLEMWVVAALRAAGGK